MNDCSFQCANLDEYYICLKCGSCYHGEFHPCEQCGEKDRVFIEGTIFACSTCVYQDYEASVYPCKECINKSMWWPVGILKKLSI